MMTNSSISNTKYTINTRGSKLLVKSLDTVYQNKQNLSILIHTAVYGQISTSSPQHKKKIEEQVTLYRNLRLFGLWISHFVSNALIKTVFTQQYKYQLQIITTIQLSNMFRPYSSIIRLTKQWSLSKHIRWFLPMGSHGLQYNYQTKPRARDGHL